MLFFITKNIQVKYIFDEKILLCSHEMITFNISTECFLSHKEDPNFDNISALSTDN